MYHFFLFDNPIIEKIIDTSYMSLKIVQQHKKKYNNIYFFQITTKKRLMVCSAYHCSKNICTSIHATFLLRTFFSAHKGQLRKEIKYIRALCTFFFRESAKPEREPRTLVNLEQTDDGSCLKKKKIVSQPNLNPARPHTSQYLLTCFIYEGCRAQKKIYMENAPFFPVLSGGPYPK